MQWLDFITFHIDWYSVITFQNFDQFLLSPKLFVRSHLICLSNLTQVKRRSCVELNAAIGSAHEKSDV